MLPLFNSECSSLKNSHTLRSFHSRCVDCSASTMSPVRHVQGVHSFWVRVQELVKGSGSKQANYVLFQIGLLQQVMSLIEAKQRCTASSRLKQCITSSTKFSFLFSPCSTRPWSQLVCLDRISSALSARFLAST